MYSGLRSYYCIQEPETIFSNRRFKNCVCLILQCVGGKGAYYLFLQIEEGNSRREIGESLKLKDKEYNNKWVSTV